MRYRSVGIGNIAWPSGELNEGLLLLKSLGCTAVEIAPFNVFGRWEDSEDQAKRLHELIASHGLRCDAIQGIFFGVPDVELFGSEGSRKNLLLHLERVAAVAETLGAGACVWGAPRQRDPGLLSAGQARDIAVDLLRRIGPTFAGHRTGIAFEANARHYGCRFINTTREAIDLVKDVATLGIGLQIDTATILLEGEPPDVLLDAVPLALHAHVSEVDLRPPGTADHRALAAALLEAAYGGSLSIEMKATADWRADVAAAVDFVKGTYA